MKYGIIMSERLILTDETCPGAKPVAYADIPEFDQTLYYIIQQAPVDVGNYIFMDIEIKKLLLQKDSGHKLPDSRP